MVNWSSLLSVPRKRNRHRFPRPTAGRADFMLEPLENRQLLSADIGWSQRGGDAGHTSYVPVSFDASILVEKWSEATNGDQSFQLAVATDGERLYRTSRRILGISNVEYYLTAYDLFSGEELWRRTVPAAAPSGVGEPTVANGIVYVNSSGHSSSGSYDEYPRLLGFHAVTGQQLLEQTYAAQWGSTERPVVADNQLVAESGYFGGFAVYTASTLATQWSAGGSQTTDVRPALSDQFVYTYGRKVFDRFTGEYHGSLQHESGMGPTDPIVSEGIQVFFSLELLYPNTVGDHGVAAYDGADHSPLWTTYTGGPVSAKAVGNGMVAATTGMQLMLLDQANGDILNTWVAPAKLTAEVVMTSSHVFVQSSAATTAQVHAIDLVTGQEVWAYTNIVETGNPVMEMAMSDQGSLLLSHLDFIRSFGLYVGIEAVDDIATVNEDESLVIAVLANDSDEDGDPLTIVEVGEPANGSAVVNADGTITYTPNPDYFGSDSFTYTISDGKGDSGTATVAITVRAVNDPPVVTGGTFTIDENAPYGTVVGAVEVSDIDSRYLRYYISGEDAAAFQIGNYYGTIVVADPSLLDFETKPQLSFTVHVHDGTTTTNATVYVNLNDVLQEAPVAHDDAGIVDEDSSVTVAVLDNDFDQEGDAMTVVAIGEPGHGTAPLNADGTVTYTPAVDFHGTDSFTYTISDGYGVGTGTVYMTIRPVNDRPLLSNVFFTLEENAPIGSWVGDASAADVDGDSLTYWIRGEDAAAFSIDSAGQLHVADSWLLDFETRPQFNFTVHASDPSGEEASAAVRVDLTDGAAAARDDEAVLNEDTAAVIAVLDNDHDEGDALTVIAASAATHGTVTINGDGTVTYMPGADFQGTDSFTYTISDGQGGSDTGSVSVTVNPVDDAPVVNDAAFALDENSPNGTVVGRVVASDVDGDSLYYSIGGPDAAAFAIDPQTGEITVADAALLDYETQPHFDFTVYVQNQPATSFDDSANVRVDLINEFDTDPVVSNDFATTMEEQDIFIPVLANDYDPEGTSLTLEVARNPQGGWAHVQSDGTIRYRPASDRFGTDSFDYRVRTSDGRTATGTVEIEIIGTDDAPRPINTSFGISENPQTTTVLGQLKVIEVDGDPLTFAISGDDAAPFAVDPATGILRIVYPSMLDYETQTLFNFTFHVNDGVGPEVTATAVVALYDRPEPPVAVDDSATTDEDAPVIIDVLANDRPDAGDPLTAITINQPANGLLTFNSEEETLTYTPNADFHGTDAFTYIIHDGEGGSDSASVSITVNPINDAPAMVNSALIFSVAENSANGTIVGTVAATDVDGDALSYAISGADAAAFAIDSQTGIITLADASLLDFETKPQFNFAVHVSDGAGGQATANVRVDLTDVLEIEIDILPGDPDNHVDLSFKEIEVAILASATFDPLTMVDFASLHLGSARLSAHPKHGYRYELRDVDGDGLLDLVLKFNTTDVGLQDGDTSLSLEGRLPPQFGGEYFKIDQAITIVSGGGDTGGGGGGGKGGGNGGGKPSK